MVSHLLFQGGGGGLSLWSMAAAEDPAYLSVVVCFAAFLANDLYGFISWRRMEKAQAGAGS